MLHVVMSKLQSLWNQNGQFSRTWPLCSSIEEHFWNNASPAWLLKLISMQQHFGDSSPSVTEWLIHHQSLIRGLAANGRKKCERYVVMTDLYWLKNSKVLLIVKSFWKSAVKCDGWISNLCSHIPNWDLNHHQLKLSHGTRMINKSHMDTHENIQLNGIAQTCSQKSTQTLLIFKPVKHI